LNIEEGIKLKDILIVGNSGFAREIEWLIERINEVTPTWNFKGFINKENVDGTIGDDNFLLGYRHEIHVVIAIGIPYIRKKLYQFYKGNANICFPNIIDPSVLMSDSVSLGKGNIICANTVLTVGISLGDFCIINLDCTVWHDTKIKDFVTINPSVNISGDVIINDLVNLGTGTQIIQGKTIGQETQTGAGSVVNSDLPGYCTAVGIPARPVKYRSM